MPGKPQIERKLAAIMFTDIAGYTAQMSKDEAVAISLLNKKESILKPLILEHNGTYVKSTGDGSLSHFNSAVDAATCAKRFQESIYDDKDLNVRVGVHLGDTIFEKGDIRGDGVNIASRIESMAVEGGVFVSKEVHDQLTNQKEFEGVSLGLQRMKGVGRLIEVFGLKGDKLSEPNPSDYKDEKIDKHSDDEVPSIAIIPFGNKGSDEDVFYAYGISADLISDCSGAGLIRVASLTDIENLDYKTLDTSELASKLFVRYIAHGSLWKIDDIFQLSIELYDIKESKVIWSDRWQEHWDNLTTIKTNLSDGLLKALDTKPKIDKKVETTNPEAYEFYLKGMYRYEHTKTLEDTKIALGLLQKAVEIDDNLLMAKLWMGNIYADRGDLDKAMKIFTALLKQCEEIGDNRGLGNFGIGHIHRRRCEFDNALHYMNRSLKIDEKLGNIAWTIGAHKEIAILYFLMGDLDQALNYSMRGIEISQKLECEINLGSALNINGLMYWRTGDFERASKNWIHSLKILEKVDSYRWIIFAPLFGMGLYNYDKSDYNTAIKYLEKSLSIQNEIGNKTIRFWTVIYLYLSYKQVGREFDISEIYTSLEKYKLNNENMEEFIAYPLYHLLEKTEYLESAYKRVQELADNLDPDVAAKFLSYPIPKAIVEEWEKVK